MDWPVVAGDLFLVAALVGLLLAPLVGAAGGWRNLARPVSLVATLTLVGTFALLALAWRQIPGGMLAAASGHAALLVAAFSLAELGGVIRRATGEPLLAGLVGLLMSAVLTVGPFALGPLIGDLPLGAYNGLLFVNPLITVATATGIDFLHLDLIYRSSPLAHRGVALPAWTSACIGYAVLGLASYGVSHLRLRSA